mgnify:FL=1
MANKITKKEMFMMIKAQVKDNAEMVAFIDHEIELLDKKASNKKATKTQEANVGIKSTILAVLEGAKPMTVTEMQGASAELGELSNQKVSALVRQLVEAGKVVKTIDKKVSRFSLADNGEGEEA